MRRAVTRLVVAAGLISVLGAPSLTMCGEPQVSNIRVSQRPNSMQVDIYYDLFDPDGDPMFVTATCSDGVSFPVGVSSTQSGSDIGRGIRSGLNKHIIWDAGVDMPGCAGDQFVVWVKACDTTDDLVAYYPLNYVPGSSEVPDMSGNVHNGFNSGAEGGPDRFGVQNGAYRFKVAEKDSVVVHQSASLWSWPTFTLSLWAKIADTGNPRTMAECWECGGDYGVNIFYYYGTHPVVTRNYYFQMRVDPEGDENYNIVVPSPECPDLPPPGEWHLFVHTYDGATQRAYIDGEFVGSNPIDKAFHAPNRSLYLGWTACEGYAHRGMDGWLDDVRIYNRALNQSEIQDLYHEGGWPLMK